MTNRKGFRCAPGLAVVAIAVVSAASVDGCSASDSANTIAPAAPECDEFAAGTVSTLPTIDASTQAFVQASEDLMTIAGTMEGGVLQACIHIATDLGVTDTWSVQLGTDAQLTEACNRASTKISAVLALQSQSQATCALAVSGGGCAVDPNVEAKCDATCSGDASCAPPDVTVACDPAQLSGQCSGTCNASATCEGSASVAAQCQGSCEADCAGTCTPGQAPKIHCEGMCSGTCYGTCGGMVTGATGMAGCTDICSGQCDSMCTYGAGMPAHCDGTCNGTCSGNCTLAANASINCGANVSCKGGCSLMYTEPKCEGEIMPPSCMANASCQGSCQGDAEATAMCTPPAVTLECSANATSDAQALITTLQSNLPPILAAVQTQGPLALKAAGHVTATGSAVVQNVTTLGGKALACAEAAVTASATASLSISVSVMASAAVSGSCGGPTS
jgi:modification target Cys-rich repeat protein